MIYLRVKTGISKSGKWLKYTGSKKLLPKGSNFLYTYLKIYYQKVVTFNRNKESKPTKYNKHLIGSPVAHLD